MVSPGTVVRSGLMWLSWHARGARVRVLVCYGRAPKLILSGTVRGEWLTVRGSSARSEIGAVGDGKLLLGRRVFVNQGCSIVAHDLIEIGDRVLIGDNVSIYDTNHHAVDASSPMVTAPVRIEAGAWISARAILLPGVTVGANSVVAAGAVVTSDIPAGSLAAGNPAVVIKQLDVPPGWDRRHPDELPS